MIILPEKDAANREALMEELQADNAALIEEGKSAPKPGSIPIDKIRAFRLYNPEGTLKPKLADGARDEHIAISGGELLTRVHQPERPDGLFIHFHGGGWALGSVYEQDAYLAAISRHANVTVISVDYPLTPEHHLSHIISVATEAATALILAHPDTPIVIGGESAGAHLSLSVALRLRDSGNLLNQVTGLNLLYGLYDLGMTPSQKEWGSRVISLSTDYLNWFYDMAMPDLGAEGRSSAQFSPLHADLSGLPHAHLIAGELDPLIDDTVMLSRLWLEAGNTADTLIFENAPHGFNGRPTGIARMANRRISNWISQRVGAAK